MIITSINVQQKNKNKCSIFIDGEFYFAVTLDCAVKFGLKLGDEISFGKLEEIKKESNREEATILAVNYISKAIKTKKQVKDYLVKKGFEINLVWEIVDRLKDLNYINDVEYAKRFAEYSSKTEGKRLSDYRLMQKGVCKTDIENARESAVVDTLSTACRLAEKRLKDKEITKELLAKTYRYLIGKGFSYEEAEAAIKPYKEN